MKCSSCGAELQPGTKACPYCGVLAQGSASRPGSPIVTGILIVAGGTIAFCVLIIAAGLLLLRAQFRANPAYQESLAMARSSPDVQNFLGRPIKEGWMPVCRDASHEWLGFRGVDRAAQRPKRTRVA